MRAGALDLIVVYRSNVLSNPENAEKYLDIVEINLKGHGHPALRRGQGLAASPT